MARRFQLFLFGVAGILAAGLLTACSPETGTAMISPTPTFAPTAPPTNTPRPLELAPPDATAPPSEPQALSATKVPCPAGAESGALTYDIDATVDWETHRVEAVQRVTYQNRTGHTLRQLVFNVDANHTGGRFELVRVKADDGRPIDQVALEQTQLTVTLPEKLHAYCVVGVTLEYALNVPNFADSTSPGYLGYGGRQLNLGLWFPLLADFDGTGDWVIPAVHTVGEQDVLPAADFNVNLAVKNAPPTVEVAGPGRVSKLDDQTWRFELEQGREIALSLSDQFHTLSTVTASGTTVELYYYPVPGTTLDAPGHALQVAADALTVYSELFGPYPRDRMVVVEGDFPDGMEFSGLVFVSEAWFRTWTGEPNDWLTIITAHEVSHQWWYALVGNDQGNHPYLDEALATYSELLFFEHIYPDLVDGWWKKRVYDYGPGGFVDARVYDFYSVREYINSVYLRGALMLQQIRDDLGDEAFFTWLREYAAGMSGRLAKPADLWGALPEDAYGTTAPIRGRYMRQADILSLRVEVP